VQVQDIMTRDVASALPLMNAAEAAEIMWNRNCGSLPVVADGGQVIGMVTDRDLFIALGTQNRRAADLAVGEIMHVNPSVCSPQEDLRHALQTMARQRVRRLPVVDESGVLQGILSIDDAVARAGAMLADDGILGALKAICEAQTKQGAPNIQLATA